MSARTSFVRGRRSATGLGLIVRGSTVGMLHHHPFSCPPYVPCSWTASFSSFLQVSYKPLLTFASRREDATVELCNTKALRLLRSSKRPENGAPGSLERTANLGRA